MEITGTLQRKAWMSRVLPPLELVGEGLWSVPIVFPNNPMRYTLAYVISDGQGECLVIDPGFDSAQGRLALQAGLRDTGHGLRDVTGILSTHFHTDHLGLAAWLRRESGAWVALGQAEKRYISSFDDPADESLADCSRMRSWGVPEDRIQEAAMSVKALLHLKGLADADLRLGNGDVVPGSRGLSVVETPGHTPGHICLKDDKRAVFISGDHVLPRITPNVSLEMRGDTDPLRSCLQSLDRINTASNFEVLPAHEYRFRGLRERVRVLKAAALERSEEVVQELLSQRNPTVWSVAEKLSWSRGFNSLRNLQLRLALSETAAHLQYLRTSGVRHDVDGLPGAGPGTA